jgi:integrase
VAKAAKDKKEQPHIARIADVLRFVHAMPTAETKAIAALAEGGGLELPAILSMRGVDVVNRAERIVFAHGSKNIYRDRQAVIDREFWPIVVTYLDAHPVHALGLVFELSDWEVRKTFREVGAALREKHVPVPAGYAPHKCRHTYRIRHLQHGEDPTLIAENLGHSDTSTLFRDYAKYRPKATEIKRAARAEEASNG